jgi:putative two-component system response regulator
MHSDFSAGIARDGPAQLHPLMNRRLRRRVWGLDVLVVDDDAADTALILTALNRNPAVRTARATDAPEFALRQFALNGELRPNLVLLDIHMPRLNGFAFLTAMRRIPTMARVPVVFLTTSCLANDLAQAPESTASLYVLKPNSSSELQARLNGVIALASAGGLAN